jgi:hypothetical protein
MDESTLNRVLFRSSRGQVLARPQDEASAVPDRHIDGPDASTEEFIRWSGTYTNAELGQTWQVVTADGGLWVVPLDEAAQLLTPNGPDSMRSRGVVLWFTGESMLVSAVDEVTGNWLELWFERVGA